MTAASEFTVKRISQDVYELWHDDTCLRTMTKAEAWPIMLGKIHPVEILDEDPTAARDGREGRQNGNDV